MEDERNNDQQQAALAYTESSAMDSGEINLGDLGLPPGPIPNLMPDPGAPAQEAPRPASKPVPRFMDSAEAPPPAPEERGEESGPELTAPGPPEGASEAAAKSKVLVFLLWILGLFKKLPPMGDVFDKVVSGLGMQRRPESMLKRANYLAAKGRLNEAISWYRQLIGIRPLSVAAYDGLGRAFFRLGLQEEAEREFIIADCLERLLHNRDDIEAATHLAQAFLDKKQSKIAISFVEPVLVAHFYSPQNRELLKTMGRVYADVRANKKLFQVYQAGLAQYPDDYEFYLLKGALDQRQGNNVEGERLLRRGGLMKALKQNPRDANAKMAMGELNIKEGREDEGMKNLREAAALQPENTGIRWRLFNLYQKKGNFDEALRCFLDVVNLEPDNEDLKYRLADFYRKNQRREEALDIYRAQVEKHPRDPKPHMMMGDLLNDMGQFEEGGAMRDLAQTLECGLKPNPTHTETLRFMKYLFSIGENAEAGKWLERGLAQWPYHGEFVLTKVRQLYGEYRYKDAIVLLKRIIAVKADVAEPHMWMGLCYQRVGDNMGALAEAQLATRLAPKSFSTHKVLGDILKEQKKLSQAQAAYEVAEMMRHAAQTTTK